MSIKSKQGCSFSLLTFPTFSSHLLTTTKEPFPDLKLLYVYIKQWSRMEKCLIHLKMKIAKIQYSAVQTFWLRSGRNIILLNQCFEQVTNHWVRVRPISQIVLYCTCTQTGSDFPCLRCLRIIFSSLVFSALEQ